MVYLICFFILFLLVLYRTFFNFRHIFFYTHSSQQLKDDGVFLDAMLNELVDEFVSEAVYDVHKQVKLGTACFNCNSR